jgi:hypothetical protein
MEQTLTPPPSGRLIAPVWTQWPLSPRLAKNAGSYPDVSKRYEKNEGSKIKEPAPASTKLNDETSKGKIPLFWL